VDSHSKTTPVSGGVQINDSALVINGDIVGRDKVTIATPPAGVSALHQLARPPADFTGREKEISDLTQAIARKGVTISGLRGLGGVGKTALALMLAEQLTPEYPDAQFYLDLKGMSTEPLTASAGDGPRYSSVPPNCQTSGERS
jgi:hypothetical protein